MNEKTNQLLANFTIVVVGLLVIGSAAVLGLGQVVDAVDPGVGPRVHAEADLYVKPQPKPDHPLKKDYPELFATEAVVVTFGADWCAACRRQALELRGPSHRYNILKVAVEDKEGKKTKWSKLMDRLELGDTIPVTIVVSKGEALKTFYGFTPWGAIKPLAEKAKKNDNETDSIDIGPLHIDWDDGVDIHFRRRDPRP